MKKLLIVCVAVAGFALVGNTSTADAGVRFNVQFGSGYGGYYGNRNCYNRPYYYGRRHSFWHDTSHYDYRPGGFYRHGNHFHYQPGRYNFHRTGHWDTIHHH